MALIKDSPIWKLFRNNGIGPWSLDNLPFHLIDASDTKDDRNSYYFEEYPFSVIHYIVSGRGFFKLNGVGFSMKTGDLFYSPAGSTLLQKSNDVDRWRKKYIVMHGAWFDTMMKLFQLSSIYHFQNIESVSSIFDQVIRLHNQFLPNRDEAASLLLFHLVWRIWNKKENKTYYSSEVNHTRIYLEEKLFSKPDLDYIAQITGFSRSHLQAKFRSEIGMSPYKYFLQLKLEKAKELLLLQHLSIPETAGVLGFYDRFHFSRMFKARFGVSPAAFCETMSITLNTKKRSD